ncbi:hypothetical protein VNI00_003498 [Paramarasmius palmivorus]|uniref:Uncharacterized protein n=1 Tax=Paramarasmius palmivorus TaxID=297713 RepID=A0AAW0DSP6_9AGAR
MTVQTGYYQIGNDGLWVALPTTEAGTALSLQYDDGSAGLKWHFDKHDGGAYYFIYSEYDDSEYSSGKLGASTTILQSNASIVGAKSSKQWIVTAVPGKKYTITYVTLVQLRWDSAQLPKVSPFQGMHGPMLADR